MPAPSFHVARAVRAERKRRDWTQSELGARIGWSTQMVSEAETGQKKLGIDDLVLLCRGLGVPLAKLLEGVEAEDLRALGLD